MAKTWRYATDEEEARLQDLLEQEAEADRTGDPADVFPFGDEGGSFWSVEESEWFLLGYPREEGWTEVLLDALTNLPADKVLVLTDGGDPEVLYAKLTNR